LRPVLDTRPSHSASPAANRALARLCRALAILAPLMLFGGISAGAQTLAGSAARPTLAPGDMIKIDVWQQKEYSGEFGIAADGTIIHPLYRELKVTGIPLTEVEGRLREFLGHYLSNPTFDIQPLMRVIVAGEVRQPNIPTVPPGTSVAQVIAIAGGPTDRGRLDDVLLVRDNSTQRLDLTRPDANAPRIEVHSGDQIVIPRRRNLMQDVISPASSVLGAVAAITAVIIQLRR